MAGCLPDLAPMNTSILKMQIRNIGKPALASETGTVLSVGDGVARIHGLSGVMAGELIEFTGQGGERVDGLALYLERDSVVAALFGEASSIKESDAVHCTGRLADVPIGEACLGRVVNAVGIPIDGKGPIETNHRGRLERRGPGIVQRQPAAEPLQTGIKAVDIFVPIGRGQCELILGDRKTGKTALAVDAILNQKGKGTFCVYVAIGQSLAEVRKIVDRLEARGAMDYTTVVAACASEAAALQYIAPFTGTTMGEYFRDSGRHALCVYDDLSKHAVAYRQLALLLGQMPGREGYPGDIFYLHARLLERAAKLVCTYYVVKKGTKIEGGDTSFKGIDGKRHSGVLGADSAKESAYVLLGDPKLGPKWASATEGERRRLKPQLEEKLNASEYEVVKEPCSGGSLTALPIIETQAGDISAYIPANVIGIADGQIILSSGLFSSGVRPAIDFDLSIGRGRQIRAMRQLVGFRVLNSFRYNRALAELTRFTPCLPSSCFDLRTCASLDRHARLTELLKQDPNAPLPIEEQCLIVFAHTRGMLDDVPLPEIRRFERELLKFMNTERPAVLRDILTNGGLHDDLKARMEAAVEAFKKRFSHATKDTL
jgi:F-type H+-transporting ATPase subunit alpha